MQFINVKYLVSAPNSSSWPDEELPEFVFIGKSNVGKSTLINSLCNNSTICKVSATPGRTRLLNFFDVNKELRLVDAPGYGYAYLDKNNDLLFAKMMREYLFKRKNLKGCCLLLDSRLKPSEDDAVMFNMIIDANLPFIIIATKCDKLNQSQKSKVINNIVDRFQLKNPGNIYLSGLKNQKGFDNIIQAIYDICEVEK